MQYAVRIVPRRSLTQKLRWDNRQQRTAFESHNGRLTVTAGTGPNTPIRPLRELGYVSVLQRISRSPPGDSTRRGTLGELALMPVD
jgi:hypothetical protein